MQGFIQGVLVAFLGLVIHPDCSQFLEGWAATDGPREGEGILCSAWRGSIDRSMILLHIKSQSLNHNTENIKKKKHSF